MTGLLALPVAAPLLAAGLLVLLQRRRSVARPLPSRAIGLGVSAGVLAVACALLAGTTAGAAPALDLGGWPPGISIVLVADAFSAVMLAVTALLTTVCLAFAAATGDDERPLFTPLVLVMSSGSTARCSPRTCSTCSCSSRSCCCRATCC